MRIFKEVTIKEHQTISENQSTPLPAAALSSISVKGHLIEIRMKISLDVLLQRYVNENCTHQMEDKPSWKINSHFKPENYRLKASLDLSKPAGFHWQLFLFAFSL